MFFVVTKVEGQPDRILFASGDRDFATQHAQAGDPDTELVEVDVPAEAAVAVRDAVRADPNALTLADLEPIVADAVAAWEAAQAAADAEDAAEPELVVDPEG